MKLAIKLIDHGEQPYDDKFYFLEQPGSQDQPLLIKSISYNGRTYKLMKPYGLFYLKEKPFPADEEPYLDFKLIKEKGRETQKMRGIQ